MNKEAIMARLAAGESLQTIGDEFAAMMNAAADEYNEAKRKEAEDAARAAAENAKVLNEKRALALNFIETLKKYCAISGVDPNDLGEVDLDDMDVLVEAMDELMDLMKAMNDLKSKFGIAVDAARPAKPLKVSSISMPVMNDDEILKSFIKGL